MMLATMLYSALTFGRLRPCKSWSYISALSRANGGILFNKKKARMYSSCICTVWDYWIKKTMLMLWCVAGWGVDSGGMRIASDATRDVAIWTWEWLWAIWIASWRNRLKITSKLRYWGRCFLWRPRNASQELKYYYICRNSECDNEHGSFNRLSAILNGEARSICHAQ
jgi:hypothetical protein